MCTHPLGKAGHIGACLVKGLFGKGPLEIIALHAVVACGHTVTCFLTLLHDVLCYSMMMYIECTTPTNRCAVPHVLHNKGVP